MGLVMVEGWWQDAQKGLKDVGKGAVAGAVAGAEAKVKGLLGGDKKPITRADVGANVPPGFLASLAAKWNALPTWGKAVTIVLPLGAVGGAVYLGTRKRGR